MSPDTPRIDSYNKRKFKRKIPAPSQVFTPTQLPLQEHNAYVPRVEAQEKIERFIGRGQIPLIYGEYGVGKNTVVRNSLRDGGFDDELVYIPTTNERSVGDVLRTALEHIGATVTTSQVTTNTSEGRAGANFVVDLGGSLSESTSSTTEFIVKSPTHNRIIELLAEYEVTQMIDELHRANDDFREELADLIKATQGQEGRWPQLVLIGTSADASTLVKIDAGIDRLLKGYRLPTMTSTEAEELIKSGFRTLEIEISRELVNTVVRTAAGAPSLVQSLCLDMAESAVRARSKRVDQNSYKTAVRSYLEENTNRLNEAYTAAIEHTGPKRYRKQILVAMSQIDSDYPELESIRAQIENNLGEKVEQHALSGPLRHLKPGTDSVLIDVKRREGARVHNVSAFRDPMMKSFIRFIAELEKRGLA